MEEIARQELARVEGGLQRTLDFGTEVDGSLAIWLDGQTYSDPDNIPEPQVRAAIVKAVERLDEMQR